MISDLVPGSFWSLAPSEDDLLSSLPQTGMVVSEDDSKVYIEAAVPGIDPDKVDVSVDNGVLWIKAKEEREEEKRSQRRYYRGAQEAYYSYRLILPDEVDDEKDPEAEYKHGKVYLTFIKKAQAQPRKITVKAK